MQKRTALYEQHLLANAHMVNFGGWNMPLHYGSQIEEHHAVRRDVGMFDVSHMTVVDLLGAGGRQFLRNLLANDVDRLHRPGSALYSCMLYHRGGIIDDLIVYFRAPDNYRLVLNASTRDNDLNWIARQAQELSVGIQERPDLAMVAVQGPNAVKKTLSLLSPAQMDATATLSAFEVAEAEDWFIARTGYTGEDGLEIILPREQAATFWQRLLAIGVQPCGLGARDTLRMEAGLLLYGQDMDDTTTPFDVGLNWTVALDPADRDFIGRAALMLQREQGLKRKMVGLLLEDKGIMRPHQKVIAGNQTGVITSGGFSPTLNRTIALARVPTQTGNEVMVEIRNKLIPAKVVKPRFVKQGKILI